MPTYLLYFRTIPVRKKHNKDKDASSNTYKTSLLDVGQTNLDFAALLTSQAQSITKHVIKSGCMNNASSEFNSAKIFLIRHLKVILFWAPL